MARSFRFVCAHCQRSQTNRTAYTICGRCHSDHSDVVAAVSLLRLLNPELLRWQLPAYIIAAAAARLAGEAMPNVATQARALMKRVKKMVQTEMFR